ncbi:unnamed protein product [Pylaiella littoralis]
MEAHLRKITRCLGKAVAELEQVSEKRAQEVDAEWMTRFHAGMAVPASLDTDKPQDVFSIHGRHESGEGGTDLRWALLKSTWLPLLQDLHHTVGLLDREESALQAAEQKEADEAAAAAAAQMPGGGAAAGNRDRAPPRAPKGLLSLRDYAVIHTALEIVVHWGLVPALEPGVGVFEAEKRPQSRAVRISRRVLHFWGTEKCYHPPVGQPSHRPVSSKSCGSPHTICVGGDPSTPGGDGHSAHAQQLALCTAVIQGVVTTEQFLPMLMPLYLPDLLAARLQLVYGRAATAAAAAATAAAAADTTPTARDSNKNVQSKAAADCRSPSAASAGDGHNTINPPTPTPATGGATAAAAAGSTGPSTLASSSMVSSLRAILKDVGPRQVMGALRHLLSQGRRAPPWLQERGGRILSDIVLRPGGVQATLEVYLAGAAAGGSGGGAKGGGQEEADQTRVCLRVAKLLATPPKRVGTGDYVSRVAPQLAEMLHFDGQQRAIVTRVVVMIIGRLSESTSADTRRLILYPLLRPLLLFWGPTGRQEASSSSKYSSPLSPPLAKKRPPSPTNMKSKSRNPSSSPPPIAAAEAAAVSVAGRGGDGTTPGAAAGGEADGGGGGGGGIAKDDIASSEERLDRCMEDLEKLLTAAPAPAALLGLLSRMGVTVPLFRLHCFCTSAKSRNLQSTKASLSALLPSSATAAPDLVAGLLPVGQTGWGAEKAPRFSPGPTGGAVLRAAPSSSAGGRRGGNGGRSGGVGEGSPGAAAANIGLAADAGSGGAAVSSLPTDDSLVGIESQLEGLGLDPETLRLVGSAAAAAAGGGAGGIELGGEGGPGAGLIGALAGLREAEGRAQAAAEVLEGLGEGSPVAGKVFDMLLRRYLSLRDGGESPAGRAAAAAAGRTDPLKPPVPAAAAAATAAAATAAASAAAEEHGVMASVVVLAERLGARVFGTGMQMLSCIRLVLEHEQPPGAITAQTNGAVASGGGCGGGGLASGGGDGEVDAAARVFQLERDAPAAAAAAAATAVRGRGGRRTAATERGFGLGLGKVREGEGHDDDDDDEGGSETLCSVVLALLTTVLELGEEERTEEEEAELRAMLGPLKGLAAGHRSAEVAEMSALLCASILSRGLTPEERREERVRVKLGGGGGGGGGGSGERREAHTARMLSALDAAEEDLRSEAVPIRARGVVTLTSRHPVPAALRSTTLRVSLGTSTRPFPSIINAKLKHKCYVHVHLHRLMRATVESGTNGSSSGSVGDGGGGGRANMDTAVAQRLMDTYARMAGDGDSYVYLAAVQGLAALADALPGWCIPRLVGIFIAASGSSSDSSDPLTNAAAGAAPSAPGLSLSQRLKIGEAVLLSARRCGEAVPKYAHYYVNAFVVAARERSAPSDSSSGSGMGSSSSSRGGALGGGGKGRVSTFTDGGGGDGGDIGGPDGDVDDEGSRPLSSSSSPPPPPSPSPSLESKERCYFRASCLSNLAEVCQLLRWSLGRFSQDVVDLGVGVLSMETGPSEEATLARRGASFLLGRLLRGAGGDVLRVVPAAELRVTFRALKRAAEGDRDNITRSHARDGLGCLDAAIRGQLFPAGGGGRGAVRGTGGPDEDELSTAASHHPGITVL